VVDGIGERQLHSRPDLARDMEVVLAEMLYRTQNVLPLAVILFALIDG